MNEILNKSSLFIEFDYMSGGAYPQKKHAKFKIGDSDNEVSFNLIQRIFEIGKDNSLRKSNSNFSDYLANEIYKSLSESEKQLVDLINRNINKSEMKSVSNVEIKFKNNESSVTDYEVRVGGEDGFDEYINDLKLAEEYTFKLKEENKYRKKMQKISGTTPMDEMMLEMAGTTFKPSNIHQTDWNRLNDHKINSPTFS